jgi:hypothetical protein
MRLSMSQIEQTLKQLDEVTSRSKELRGKASMIENKFKLFDQAYLRDEYD